MVFFPIFFMGTGDDSGTAPHCLGSSTGSNQAMLEDSIKWDISKGVAETVVGKNYRICKLYRVQIQTEVVSDLKRENHRDIRVHMIDIY